MSVIYVLLAISIIVAVLFFIAFIISVKSGQYDDSYTPSVRMLFEDELVKVSAEKTKNLSLPGPKLTGESELQQAARAAALAMTKIKRTQPNKQL